MQQIQTIIYETQAKKANSKKKIERTKEMKFKL